MNRLLSAFKASITIVKEHISGEYLFLLTDNKGKLTAMDYCPDMEESICNSPIRLGFNFSEDNYGVNAISETMRVQGPVYLTPEQHESPYFQSWHCFATPLIVEGKLVGYLDVSTINEEMKGELIAIAKLISINMLDCYAKAAPAHELGISSESVLTDRQLDVLKLISEGHTVKSIAVKLHIKESTVNHHKKVIFERLGVQSSAEAVRIASQLQYLR